MINPKASILLATLAVLGLFQLSYVQPQLFYWNLIFVNLILILALRNLPELKFSHPDYWNLLILPFLFLNSSLIYFSLLSEKFLIQFVIIFSSVFIYYYLRRIYLYLQGDPQATTGLVNISSLGTILVVFFLSVSLYGLRVNLQLPIWWLILGLLAVISLITYQAFWVNGIKLKLNLFYVLIVDLLIIELAWTLFFLSFAYHILGVILTICYYVIIGLTKFNLKEALNRQRLKFYLGVGLGSIFLILLTARIL